MKKLAFLAITLCLSLGIASAQGPKPHGHHPKFNKEAKAELEKLEKEKVYPVKKAAHTELMTKFSKEDLAFLDTKRKEAKALQEEQKAIHQQIRSLKESGKSKEEIHAAMETAMAPIKEKRKAFMQSMKPFMERNLEPIKATMESLKPQHEQWMQERKAIVEKYLTPEQKQKMEARKQEMEKKHAEHAGKHEKHQKMMHAVKFVLWDGEYRSMEERMEGHPGMHHRRHADCAKDGKDCEKGKNKSADNGSPKTDNALNTKEEVLMNLSNYPNPAISQTTILFELKEPVAKATLTITDTQGKQVFRRNYNKLDAGEQKLDIDLHKFTNGQYFYTLEIDDKQMTKTLIVNQ